MARSSGERKDRTMKIPALLALALVMISGPAFAQQISIDYDENYDTRGIETFAWAVTSKTSVAEANPLLHSRILNGIEYYLTLAGAREVESDPDVYVTYHASTREQVVLNTSSWGYGYPGGWGHYGRSPHYGVHAGPSTTTVSTYERGTLVVDVWDAKTETLVWRGIASNISVYEDPVKMKKRIDKALKKMVKKWEKIKKKRQAETQD
jgi:hypothetical protein